MGTGTSVRVGTEGGGGPGGQLCLSWGPTHSLGSVLLFTHCNQRDETASPLKYHSCQHLKVNSSPHICVKKGTVITTTFSDDAKKTYFLTKLLLNMNASDLFSSLNFAFITNLCNPFMEDNAMSANVE